MLPSWRATSMFAGLDNYRGPEALVAVPVSTVLHRGRTGVLRRIKLGRHVRSFRADIERLVREQDDEGVS